MSENFFPEDRLKLLLNAVKTHHHQLRFQKLGRKLPDNPSPFDYIVQASQAFLSGALPNSETLMFLASALDRYVREKGEMTLDDAFQLRSKPKAGNPSRQYNRSNEMNIKLFGIANLRASSSITIEAAAYQVCEKDSDFEEVSTLKREYSRGKWRKVEAFLRGK